MNLLVVGFVSVVFCLVLCLVIWVLLFGLLVDCCLCFGCFAV